MYFEDFEVGCEYGTDEFEVTLQQILDFAGKYDPLPMHLDAEYSKNTRFGSIIASGPMTYMLIWSGFLRKHNILGAELIAGKRNSMTWPKPTYPGDKLHGLVSIVDKIERNAYNGIIVVKISAWNQQNQQVLDGGAEIVVKRRPTEDC